jgi:hypothetical protein
VAGASRDIPLHLDVILRDLQRRVDVLEGDVHRQRGCALVVVRDDTHCLLCEGVASVCACAEQLAPVIKIDPNTEGQVEGFGCDKSNCSEQVPLRW